VDAAAPRLGRQAGAVTFLRLAQLAVKRVGAQRVKHAVARGGFGIEQCVRGQQPQTGARPVNPPAPVGIVPRPVFHLRQRAAFGHDRRSGRFAEKPAEQSRRFWLRQIHVHEHHAGGVQHEAAVGIARDDGGGFADYIEVAEGTTVEKLFAEIAASQQKTLRVVLKCDVFGSIEAVRHILDGIKSQKVSLEIVSGEVGLIGKNDVLMAGAAGAVIVGFNTKLENGVTPLAKHHGVRIENFDIIYELGDKVREIMADLLEPDLREVKLGAAEVRQLFPVSKGFVAGCLVTEGKMSRNAPARVRRGKETLFEGKIGTLRRFKDDANEVRAGLECGIRVDGFEDYKEGDGIECLEIQKVRASL